MSVSQELLQSTLSGVDSAVGANNQLPQNIISQSTPTAILHRFNRQTQASHQQPKPARLYVQIGDYQVEYHTGAQIKYFGEYSAYRVRPDFVSFPLERCDPLPTEQAGSIRFFFTSAIEGALPVPGQPVHIIAPNITQVVVVRAKSESNGHTAQVYVGIDLNKFKRAGYKGCNKIYIGEILAIQYKDTQHVEMTGCYFGPSAKYLDSTVVGKEMKNHLENPIDYNWSSPVFQQHLNRLFCNQPDVYFQHGCLMSNNCYWTKDENKLKKGAVQRLRREEQAAFAAMPVQSSVISYKTPLASTTSLSMAPIAETDVKLSRETMIASSPRVNPALVQKHRQSSRGISNAKGIFLSPHAQRFTNSTQTVKSISTNTVIISSASSRTTPVTKARTATVSS